MEMEKLEEGSPCPNDTCSGKMELSEIIGCTCHINPPCSACVDAGYECNQCHWESNPAPPPIVRKLYKFNAPDRTGETTSTRVDSPYNSTPFTKCCGVAAINESHCPACNAEILGHDDGLSTRRREVGAGCCLMCGRPRGDIAISGNCCC